MSDDPDIRVVPATADRWDDVAAVFSTRGDPSRCWCQWFRMRNARWRQATTATNRTALRRQLDDAAGGTAAAPGLLAYLDGEPAGWCALAPRPEYERIVASPTLRTARRDVDGDDPADPAVWSITCFVVRVGARRKGVAAALVDAAVEFAAVLGATVVEGYPVDVTASASVSSSGLYHGTLTMFANAGFTEVARAGGARPVVRLDLTP